MILTHPPLPEFWAWFFTVVWYGFLVAGAAFIAFVVFALVLVVRDEWRRFANRSVKPS